MEGQVPAFISPRKKVAQLYPQALGSLFVASYDSQRYGRGIRTRLHTGVWTTRVEVKAKVTLRLAVYRQSVRLDIKLLETHDQRFFFN
jgi:hypothetical protein